MAGKTLINGTAYTINGGRTLIGGTGYDIKSGKTLIGGTGQTISFVKMPVKGNLIWINSDGTNRTYRVLKVNGSVAEVMSYYYPGSSRFNREETNNNYKDSILDNYLNSTYYNSLRDDFTAAIIPKNIIQYNYSRLPAELDMFFYADYSSKSVKTSVGLRNIYALDIEDIEMYFGGTGGSVSANSPGSFNKSDLLDFFLSDSDRADRYWLRSSATEDYGVWEYYISSSEITITSEGADLSRFCLPVCQIDLSKIPFTIVG
nr:MAG TPA: hypothetical protein [Caudoviricetes sp.]